VSLKPPIAAADLHRSPNALAPHYSRFDVANRLLLTGHSHQAWPDRGFDGQQRAWLDAAEHADGKWELAFEKADRVRRGYARLLDADPAVAAGAGIALAASTHDLVVRFLSALPLGARPRLVTTTGEFHAIRRQLDRLAEAGLEIVKVERDPVPELAGRLARAVDGRTAAVLVSTVFFQDARIVPGLASVLEACRREGAELLVDAYHHLDIVPFSLSREGLEGAFVTGGGYKYCQLGEGNAFLRAPEHAAAMRPVVTGWFSEFGTVVGGRDAQDLFAGATYDPTSHYRAAEVFDFFEEMALTPELLREVSRHQIALLVREFDALDLDPRTVDRDREAPLEEVAGFLALRSPRAGELQGALLERGVRTDHRDDILRMGPAPYLTDDQLRAAVAALGEAARA
jgi:kynureninase